MSASSQVVALRSVKPRGRPFTRENAAEMGRRGGLIAAVNREDHLASVREQLALAALPAAKRLAAIAKGEGPPGSMQELRIIQFILDRTIGKGPMTWC